MSTVIEIVNMALGHVGDEPIVGLSDPNKRARLCTLNYDSARRRALRMHPWTSVSKRASIAKDATAPDWGFGSRYALPNDYIRLLFIENQSDDSPYEVVGDYIETDLGSPIAIKYVYNEPDTTRYDALLTTIVTYSLALDLVEPLTQSNTKKKEIESSMLFWLNIAKQVNGRERRPGRVQDTSWLRARRVGG